MIFEVPKAMATSDCDTLAQSIWRVVSVDFHAQRAQVVLMAPGSLPKTLYGRLQWGCIRDKFLSRKLSPLHFYSWSVPFPSSVLPAIPSRDGSVPIKTPYPPTRPLSAFASPSLAPPLMPNQDERAGLKTPLETCRPLSQRAFGDQALRSSSSSASRQNLSGMVLEIDVNDDIISDLESASNSPSTPSSPLTSMPSLPCLKTTFSDPVKDQRVKSVAVIGGGLMAVVSAIELHSRGYRVTLFEKENMVTPRKYTTPIDGEYFDISPLYYVRNAQTQYLDRMLRRIGVCTEKGIFPYYFEECSRTELIFTKEIKRCGQSLQALAEAVKNDFGSYNPSYSTLLYSKHGSIPIAEWLRRQPNVTHAAELLTIPVTASGCGYISDRDVTTAQWLSHVLARFPNLRTTTGHTSLVHVPGGYRAIWKAALEYMGTGTMQFNSEVISVSRSGVECGNVSITTRSGELLVFDDVVCACSAVNTKAILDNLSADESQLLSSVHSPVKYYTVLATVIWPPNSPFNRPVVYWAQHSQNVSLAGHIVRHHCHKNSSDLVTFYVICKDDIDVTDMVRHFHDDLSNFNISICGILNCRRCDTMEVIAGTPSIVDCVKMSELQGLNHTYHMGKYLCEMSMPHQADHAKSLIHERFPSRLLIQGSTLTPSLSRTPSTGDNHKPYGALSPTKALRRLTCLVAKQMSRLVVETAACEHGVSVEEAAEMLCMRG